MAERPLRRDEASVVAVRTSPGSTASPACRACGIQARPQPAGSGGRARRPEPHLLCCNVGHTSEPAWRPATAAREPRRSRRRRTDRAQAQAAEIRLVEVGQRQESLDVIHGHPVCLDSDQVVVAQLAQRAIDVRNAAPTARRRPGPKSSTPVTVNDVEALSALADSTIVSRPLRQLDLFDAVGSAGVPGARP